MQRRIYSQTRHLINNSGFGISHLSVQGRRESWHKPGIWALRFRNLDFNPVFANVSPVRRRSYTKIIASTDSPSNITRIDPMMYLKGFSWLVLALGVCVTAIALPQDTVSHCIGTCGWRPNAKPPQAHSQRFSRGHRDWHAQAFDDYLG